MTVSSMLRVVFMVIPYMTLWKYSEALHREPGWATGEEIVAVRFESTGTIDRAVWWITA